MAFLFARKAFLQTGAAVVKQYLFGIGNNQYGETGVTDNFANYGPLKTPKPPVGFLSISDMVQPYVIEYTVGEVLYEGVSLAAATATGKFVSFTVGGYWFAEITPLTGEFTKTGGIVKGATSNAAHAFSMAHNGSTSPDSWAQVSLRFQHALATKSDGTLWGTGQNSNFQLADGTNTQRGYFKKIGTSANWKFASTGDEFVAVLDKSGQIWTCGNNSIAAQCHNGTTTGDVTTLHNTATTTTVNHPALLNLGATTGTFSVNEFVYQGAWAAPTFKARVLIHDTTNRVLTLSCTSGTLATGSLLGRTSAASATVASTVTSPPFIINVRAGHRYVMAIDTNNRLWAWGNNGGDTELGRVSQNSDSTAADYVTNPTQDPNMRLVNFPAKFSESYPGDYSCMALTTEGQMVGWGSNSAGQLGAQSFGSTGLPPFVVTCAAGQTWVSASCGQFHTMLLRNDGTLWSSGRNTNGQCGVNSLSNLSAFTQVANPSSGSWVAVSAGGKGTLAIDTLGRLWGWGSNASWQLGLPSNVDYLVPTLVDSAKKWASVSAGNFSAIATAI